MPLTSGKTTKNKGRRRSGGKLSTGSGQTAPMDERAKQWTLFCDQLRKSADGLYEMCEMANDVAATKVRAHLCF
jgi:hypothetical protein